MATSREDGRQNPSKNSDHAAAGQPPFLDFTESLRPQSALRAAITAAYRCPEPEIVPSLLEQARLPTAMAGAVQQLAHTLAHRLRSQSSGGRAGIVQGLLQEFSLSSQEGVALMCLAEALLRVPDEATRDELIRDKISSGDWHPHLGQSRALFVNAAIWGLLLTGRLVATHNQAGLSASLTRIIGKSGEPLIRRGVNLAMRLMSVQFIAAETISEALGKASAGEARDFRYSYDMLGEAALTTADAQRYCAAYEQAIHAVGEAAGGRGIYEGPGISIKLSALHPRYTRPQYQRVQAELYPRLLALTRLARHYDIGLSIDAEEADRLELSLDLLERLCFEPELAGWNGIGFVIQAYQKRCPSVIAYLIDLARSSRRRLMIRLVKGAYWDSEIKLAQINGLEDYPAYTRKVYTDITYLACARKLLAAPDAVYPQFATHNAHTLAAVYHLAGPSYHREQYEFQCLYGMGEPLYEQVVGQATDGKLNRPCRIYAPVGSHRTLLPYLVRRLLENGANTSFINRIADRNTPIADLIADPVATVEAMAIEDGKPGAPHPRIPLPRALYGCTRVNSRGLDLSNEQHLAALATALRNSTDTAWRATPMLGCVAAPGTWQPVRNPADHRDVVGQVREASAEDIDNALQCAVDASPIWQVALPGERAGVLERAADRMEADMQRLVGLLIREAGKTFANAISEVREAVDFLRYYAAQVRTDFANDSHRPLGPVVCISPWNFPLAIFTGQIGAALAAGNTVLAKPAEQAPLIAALAVRILHEAGIPASVLQLLPGRGESVGAGLVADARVRGVLFTGSVEVARSLQRSLAGRLDAQSRTVPLIAETGGLNAMIVDSSALTEQVVNDVVASAFDSAGQRCSALRVLCLQEEIADQVLTVLRGAMAEYRLGNPARLQVDIGPVIDAEAQARINAHIETMRDRGHSVFQSALADADECRHGTFVLPTLIELDHIDELEAEIFGPVLHVVRYQRQDLDSLLDQINAAGYGLTMGAHTRIDRTIARISERARVGNLYVNRNMVGAVVGVQPFGGEGLSGTGPKAGGPLYLYRLLAARPADAPARALNRNWNLLDREQRNRLLAPLHTLGQWAGTQGLAQLHQLCQHYAASSLAGTTCLLLGPTGERNTYTLQPRDRVLCLADNETDLLAQLAAVLAAGSTALWPARDPAQGLHGRLPQEVQAHIATTADWTQAGTAFDAVLHHGDPERLREVSRQVSQRSGAIVPVHGFARGEAALPLELLLVERVISVNTAALGGNPSLLTNG